MHIWYPVVLHRDFIERYREDRRDVSSQIEVSGSRSSIDIVGASGSPPVNQTSPPRRTGKSQ
jgi:hypothetical protein